MSPIRTRTAALLALCAPLFGGASAFVSGELTVGGGKAGP